MTLFPNMQTTLAVMCQTVCSVGMMLFNKMAVREFPVECTLVAMQMSCTVLVMLSCCWSSLRVGSLRDLMRWSLVAPFFAGTLLTNILSLKYSSMTMVIVFRALSPLLSLACEQLYPEPVRLSPYSVGAILVMFAGASTYTMSLPSTEFKDGIHWVLLNILFAVGDRLLQRLMLARQQDPVDISMTAAALLNSLFGQIPVLIVMYYQREFLEIPGAVASLTVTGRVWVALSCTVSVGMGYVSIWAQSRITATSFLVLMNANKFIIIFLEAFCLSTTSLTPVQIASACVAVLGGICYSNSRPGGAARGKAAGESQPLVQKQPQPAV